MNFQAKLKLGMAQAMIYKFNKLSRYNIIEKDFNELINEHG